MIRHFFKPQRSNNHRAKILHPEGFFILSLIIGSVLLVLQALTGIGVLGDILGFASSITPSEVVNKTNEERAKLGLPALVVNANLTQAALAKGQDVFTDQYWAHVAPDGKQPWDFMKENGYIYVVAGENLARDFADTGGMMGAWMDSPTHRANIINSRYSEIGIAVIDGKLQGTETTLVVQMFGAPGGGVTLGEGASAVVAGSPVSSFVAEVPSEPIEQAKEAVLASALIPLGRLENSPIFSPLQLSKAFTLLMVFMILTTLIYDLRVIGHFGTMRLVGHNLAHIMLFLLVSFLIVFFKAGVVG